jgi:ceramide glucosyltransferase
MEHIGQFCYWLGLSLVIGGIVFVLIAAIAVRRFGARPWPTEFCLEPVTVLKPLCGLEPDLYDNLRSFCLQDHPRFQLVFGVRDAHDPAIPIVQRILAELPDHDLALVVDPAVVGSNLKVSNLCNMMRTAKHPLIVVADADMRVGPDYLRIVTASFRNPAVGAVTCLYKGVPATGFASALGALFINEWFLPSVLVTLAFEPLQYCFGATMAIRDGALRAIGGFESLASDLADDHLLGKRISEQGYQVVLSSYLVENRVLEDDINQLLRHELRWARTIKAVRLGGYVGSFVTYPIAVSLLFWLGSGGGLLGSILMASAVCSRLLLHCAVTRCLEFEPVCKPWALPLRDVLCFGVWAASFCGRRVHWKSDHFNLESNGHLIHEGKHSL